MAMDNTSDMQETESNPLYPYVVVRYSRIGTGVLKGLSIDQSYPVSSLKSAQRDVKYFMTRAETVEVYIAQNSKYVDLLKVIPKLPLTPKA